ncbi:C4-dicarboxylate ABC transporter permease [Arsenicitalea aurantiaca]|uniref:C4-dicarboxylate ABC transporter permease n=1 Tax=Arsenicitalea aurantiaca TaxID=1783274 RepID=A0A433X7N6_9HYPH|nr:tripartite tricarboxylate transporter permease [Arsenicitalea aurantiaca]RUT30086.1 C4-dicarboxylate ABC transporter permease [Arsenicitalea aurantiaca]
MIELIGSGLLHVLEPANLVAIVCGVLIGMAVGVIPGLSGGTTMTILLPLVLLAPPDTAVLFLISIWGAAVYAGSISAICLNIPGTAAAAATTLDGFALAKSGRARLALRASIIGSTIGGMASALALLFLSPLLARLALSFGPAEMFAFALFGMATVASLSSGSLLKGAIATFIGLAIATVGIAPTGQTRLVLQPGLVTGVPLIPLLIGLFTIPAAIEMMRKGDASIAIDLKTLGGKESFLAKASDWAKHGFNFLRSGLIGVVIGVLPGAGPTIASFIAYGEAKRAAKPAERQSFGKGNIDGVIAPETANNAAVFSSLVPALALGIPGSVDAVIVMAALTSHGLVPGPLLIERSADVAYTVFIGAFVANVVMLVLGLYLARYIANITRVRQSFLGPGILVLALLGAFSVHNDVFEVLLTLVVGVGAWFLRKLGVPMAPIILGAILGPMLETYLVQALVLYGGAVGAITTRPVAAVLGLLAILSIVVPPVRRMLARRRAA